jgi:hypothetical protein
VNTTEGSFHNSTLKQLCKEWVLMSLLPFVSLSSELFRHTENMHWAYYMFSSVYYCLRHCLLQLSTQLIMPEAHEEIYNGLHLKFCYCQLILTKIGVGEQILLKITEMNID